MARVNGKGVGLQKLRLLQVVVVVVVLAYVGRVLLGELVTCRRL